MNDPFHECEPWLDQTPKVISEKVFGFLIAAIAAQLVLDGPVQVGVLASVSH